MDELLDDLLAPRAEGAPSEAAAKALDAAESDAFDFDGVSVEHRDAGVGQDLDDLVLLPALEIVIAENANGRDTERGGYVLRKDARLFRSSVVGEIAAQQEDVRRLRDFREQLQHRALRRLLDVNVGNGRDSQRIFLRHYLLPS